MGTLEEQVANSRTDYMNGTVVYDLTSDIDFSHPKKTAEALAKVLFEKDISRWINGEKLEVTPLSKLEIRILKGQDKKVQTAINETTNYLKYKELTEHYKSQLNDEANAYLQARAKYYDVVYSATNARQAKKEMDEEALNHALKKLTKVVFSNIIIITA